MYTRTVMKWSDGDFDMLEIKIPNTDMSNVIDYNVTIDQMEKVCKIWQQRDLTIIGEVLIVNSLLVLESTICTYKMSVLLILTKTELERNKLLFVLCDDTQYSSGSSGQVRGGGQGPLAPPGSATAVSAFE